MLINLKYLVWKGFNKWDLSVIMSMFMNALKIGVYTHLLILIIARLADE